MADVIDRRPGGGGASAENALYKDAAGSGYHAIAEASFLFLWNTTSLDWEKISVSSFQGGAGNWAVSQVDIDGTADLIAAARATRRTIVVQNLGSTAVYLGPDDTVTTTTGFLLPGTAGAAFHVPWTGAVYGITAGATQRVAASEVYD